jgi:hypothetical protein
LFSQPQSYPFRGGLSSTSSPHLTTARPIHACGLADTPTRPYADTASFVVAATPRCDLSDLGVSLSSTQFGGIDDERPRFAHFRDCGRRVVRPQIDAPACVFNHRGPNA